MTKRNLPLFALALMFVFIGSVLALHFYNSLRLLNAAGREFELPFFSSGVVKTASPETESAGFAAGDRLVAINGAAANEEVYAEEMKRAELGKPVNVTVERKTADGGTERLARSVLPRKIDKNLSFYTRLFVGFVWVYFIPTFCALLGLWVVSVRPHDFLAWLLLFLLLGFASLGLEGYPHDSLVGLFRNVFFSCWALSMLLFGIYFPERWSADRKLPWAKWIFIVPLCGQILLTLLSQLKRFLGVNVIDYLDFVAKPYENIAAIINIAAIAVFFAAFGHKAGTLANPDARRRMKLTAYGTSAAMLPSFVVVLVSVFTGRTGSFFDLVPWWFAVFALLMMMLFPLTLAYVIVVQRAMDVRVVVRQGLQYALAKNGVLAVQIFLSFGVILTALSFVTDSQTNRPQKITFIALGVAAVFLIRLLAERIKRWTDRKFFREAYDAEQILADLSEQVRTIVETKPLLETVSGKISESLHVPQVALLLKNGDAFQPAYALGFEHAPAVSLAEGDKVIEKLKSNEPLVVYRDEQDSWLKETARAGELENLDKLNSQLLLPFGAKNELSGLISLSPKLSDSPYTPTDLRLLRSVAAQTGLALENSRLTEAIALEAAQRERINREVEIAREVQERLFPQELPAVAGLDYYGACRPALGVGGDYYDFLELPEGKFGLAIGDVSGKGIGASLMMASLQASLRGQAIHFKNDLSALMSQVNRLVYEASTSNRYATFFYAQFDPQTRVLSYVNAGHNPPFLFRKNEADYELLRLEAGGAVVGMLPPMIVSYKQGEIELQTGDLLVGFTDGISEAMNRADEEWGEERMIEAIRARVDLSAREMLEYLVECADRFADGAEQHDDMTGIVVRLI